MKQSRLSKEFFISSTIVVLILIAGFYLWHRYTSTDREGALPTEPGEVPQSVQRKLDDSKFGPSQYIAPLEDNSTGSIYSPRAQIRGVVSSLEEDELSVDVVDQTFAISLPENVLFRCMPLTMPSQDGKEVKTSEVYLDFRNAGIKGELVASDIIPSKISLGDDVTLQVNVDKKDKMEAELIVGYGCTI